MDLRRVAIVGSRDFTDRDLIGRSLDCLITRHPQGASGLVIVSGGARGADSIAVNEAKARGIATEVFPADWTHLGKRAGFARNTTIVEHSDMLIAFYAGSTPSKGTTDTLRKADAAGKPTYWHLDGQWHRNRAAAQAGA